MAIASGGVCGRGAARAALPRATGKRPATARMRVGGAAACSLASLDEQSTPRRCDSSAGLAGGSSHSTLWEVIVHGPLWRLGQRSTERLEPFMSTIQAVVV